MQECVCLIDLLVPQSVCLLLLLIDDSFSSFLSLSQCHIKRCGRSNEPGVLELSDEDGDEHHVDDDEAAWESFEAAFFRSILKINEGEYSEARRLIQKARDVLDIELTAFLAESYAR